MKKKGTKEIHINIIIVELFVVHKVKVIPSTERTKLKKKKYTNRLFASFALYICISIIGIWQKRKGILIYVQIWPYSKGVCGRGSGVA